jgi:uncharacterized protein
MNLYRPIRILYAVAVFGSALIGTASGQTKPTPAALLIAKELIELKGATMAFDALVPGVIEYHKNNLLQINPNLSRELNQVAQQLNTELAPRRLEMQQELARIYAQFFTEQELKDALAFFKTPLGKKLITEEPKALEESMKSADNWSRKFAEEVVDKIRAEMRKRGHSMF